jgi:hypothetical protein
MGLLQEWRSKLKNVKEAAFPEYEEPPVHNTLGGINQQPASIPVIDANEDSNSCNINCDALAELLNWAGADRTQTDFIIDKIKTLSKHHGSISTEHLNDILVPASQTPENSQPITKVIPVAANGLESSRLRCYNENLEKVMNSEEIEIVKKKDE